MHQKTTSIIILSYGALSILLVANGNIAYLVHPNYNLVILASGVLLCIMGITGIILGRREKTKMSITSRLRYLIPALIPALLLFVIHPRPLSSNWNQNLESGTTTIGGAREKKQVSQFSINTENRSLSDWISLLNGHRAPEEHKGEKVRISGFITMSKELGSNYFQISRHIISCCAADAQIIGLPVRYASGTKSALIKPDAWVEISGTIDIDTINGSPSPIIVLTDIKSINPPANPYEL